jgi:hypothetical protein
VAEAQEFALDAPVSPPRVLPGQPPDQLTDLLSDWRAPGGTGAGLLVLDDARCQASRVPGVTIRCSRRGLASRLVKAAITARSAQSGFGRVTWRRKTAISCRSTKISTSLDVSLRAQRQPAERPDHDQVGDAEEHECRGQRPRSDALYELWHATGTRGGAAGRAGSAAVARSRIPSSAGSVLLVSV